MGEGIPEQAADTYRHVDTGPFQFVQGDDLQVDDTQAAFLPYGFDAQQVQKLRDVLAAAAHVGAGPHDHADILRIFAFVADVLLDHAVAQLLPGHPAGLGRQRPGIHPVEVAAGRQQVYAAGAGRTGRPGRDIFAGKGRQGIFQFVLCPHKPGIDFRNDIICQGFDLFLPFRRALCDLRQFHGGGHGFFRETVFRKDGDKRPAFAADTAQQFAAGEIVCFNHGGRILFRFLKADPEFFRPQIIQGRNRTVRQAQQVHQLADEDFPGRGLAQYMEPYMDLAVLQLFNVSVEFRQVIGKRFRFIVVNGFVQLRLMGQLQNLFLKLRRLFRIFFCEVAVLVCHLFQFRQLVESSRFRHGGRQVADEAGAAPAFGDDAFAGNGHQVRINVGQGAQGDIGITGTVQACGLARQPFQVAVGAQVDHRVRLEHFPQPVIEGQVLVGGRDGRIVVGPRRIHAVLAGGLHGHEHIAVHGARH